MTQPLPYLKETASQTAGPYVHIGLAPGAAGFDIYRNELGREIAASTLNSVSSLIDAKGRVVDPTAEFTADTRTFEMGLRDNVNLSVRVAPVLSWAALIVAAGAVLVAGLRKPRDAE